MARVMDFFVSGTVDNLVLYRRMGKSCSRIKRSHIKQTDATKIRGVNFGIAARAGKALRAGLHDLIPFPTDRSMQSRFSGAIAKWLGTASVEALPPCDAAMYISNFQFTPGYTFKERFKVPVSVSQQQDNTLTVSIDAFVPTLRIAAPAGTFSVTLVLSVAGCLLQNGVATGSKTHSIAFPFNDIEVPAQVLAFSVPTPVGSLTVTGARLLYHGVGGDAAGSINNPAFMPAGVINGRYG